MFKFLVHLFAKSEYVSYLESKNSQLKKTLDNERLAFDQRLSSVNSTCEKLKKDFEEESKKRIAYQESLFFEKEELRKELKETKEELKESEEYANDLEKELDEHVCTAEKVIALILKRGIAYYDYKKLKHDERLKYYQTAQGLLRNDVLRNEVNHFFADTIEEIAKSSKNFDDVIALRMSMNGIEAILKERLTSIEDPNKPIETLDPDAEI